MTDLLLLSKDTPIAKVVDGQIQAILPARLPLFLRRTGDIRAWLESRAIDRHRTNSRLLKRALRLESPDDLRTVLRVNAATITDNYWVKPLDDSRTTWADVRYTVNRFALLALTGDANSFNQPFSRTPELTNTGSFEKCWRLVDGQWWLVKAGTAQELFSELLIYRIGQRLGFPMAEYQPDGDFIRSRDFTHHAAQDFESAVGIIGDASGDYVQNYQALQVYGQPLADAYLQMCYLDALVFNMDRHENNFGVLRDSDTGAVCALAPFYDHNIALVSRGYPKSVAIGRDILIDDFTALAQFAQRPLSVPVLGKEELEVILQGIPWALPVTDAVPEPARLVVDYLLARQAKLREENCAWIHECF
ncbi:MAG: HipA domain-containing protein [Oscillospiraceae bacterium]|jgi:hypothetical protein|nr:HipA domain-containing protein [Oscillospiraceae bacterium]